MLVGPGYLPNDYAPGPSGDNENGNKRGEGRTRLQLTGSQLRTREAALERVILGRARAAHEFGEGA